MSRKSARLLREAVEQDEPERSRNARGLRVPQLPQQQLVCGHDVQLRVERAPGAGRRCPAVVATSGAGVEREHGERGGGRLEDAAGGVDGSEQPGRARAGARQ
jgi:hypothetical protein